MSGFVGLRCLAPLPGGGVCRERVRLSNGESRFVTGETGEGVQARLVFCPGCGLRRQELRDAGPSAKAYIPRR